MPNLVECQCGTCTWWGEPLTESWTDDYDFAEGDQPNPLLEPGAHRECMKANDGKGAHIVATTEDQTIYTVAECYCPDYEPSWQHCANQIERLGQMTKRTVEILPILPAVITNA